MAGSVLAFEFQQKNIHQSNNCFIPNNYGTLFIKGSSEQKQPSVKNLRNIGIEQLEL